MTTPNLDATDLRLVRKGVTVRNAAGDIGYVEKVSRGTALVKWPANRYVDCCYCSQLTVVPDTPSPAPKRPRLRPYERQDIAERIKALEAAGLHASADALRLKL